MKTSILRDVRHIDVSEVSVPGYGPTEVLIKVMACGICGTDVHIYEGDQGAADNPLPIVLGHEFSGLIEALGSDVRGLSIGDRVAVDPNVLCGSCPACLSGSGHFCEHMIGIGTTVNGGFAEYCVVPASQVYRLADETTFEEGAMSEPLACCLHGIDLCEIEAGEHVLVIGGGMIGLLMLQLAKFAGAGFVALIEPVAEKRVLALELGADLTIDPYTEDAQAVLTAAGIKRLGSVIECVGLPQTMEQAISLAGTESVVMLFGLGKPDDSIAVKPFELFKKEITLRASFINPYTMGRAVDLINRKKIDVQSMIYARIGQEELADVLGDRKRRSRGKYIVLP